MAFKIYKRSQGKYTRLWTAFGAGVIIAFGCVRLSRLLAATELGPWFEVMVPAGLFVGLGLLVFYLVNKPVIANFMIMAEGEMKKVSWSSRKEIMVSTFVVIMVVIIMAILLGMTDLGFRLLFNWILS